LQLKSTGFDVNTRLKNEDGHTAEELSAISGHKNVLRILQTDRLNESCFGGMSKPKVQGPKDKATSGVDLVEDSTEARGELKEREVVVSPKERGKNATSMESEIEKLREESARAQVLVGLLSESECSLKLIETELRRGMAGLQTQLDKKEETEKDLRDRLAELEFQLDEARTRSSKLEALEEMAGKMAPLREKLERSRVEAETAQESRRKLEAHLEEATEERGRTVKALEEMEGKMAPLREELKSSQAEAETAQLAYKTLEKGTSAEIAQLQEKFRASETAKEKESAVCATLKLQYSEYVEMHAEYVSSVNADLELKSATNTSNQETNQSLMCELTSKEVELRKLQSEFDLKHTKLQGVNDQLKTELGDSLNREYELKAVLKECEQTINIMQLEQQQKLEEDSKRALSLW